MDRAHTETILKKWRALRMKIALIGNSGFIGSSLQNRLHKTGHDLVLFNSKINIFNSTKLTRSLAEAEILIWCASSVNPLSAEANPGLVKLELEKWTHFIAELQLEGSNSGQKLLFLSSGGCVYNSAQDDLTETSPADGINAYGIMKREMEKLLESSSLNWTILRISNVYGSGQKAGRGQGVIAEWVNSIKRGENITMIGSPLSYRDYIYLDDVIDAISMCLGSRAREIYNIGSGMRTTLISLIQSFEIILGKELTINPVPPRVFDRAGFVLNNAKFSNEFNWNPKVSLQDGLRTILKSV